MRPILSALAVIVLLAPSAAPAQDPPPVTEARDAEPDAWRTLGLLRIRDMTPFGINRLDMLPAHTVPTVAGTVGIEITFNYQNTWAVSDGALDYLEERGLTRGAIGPDDVAAMIDRPGEIYLVDGEFGVADLTLHYAITDHLGVYATLPYYTFSGGFLDSTIEGFHHGIGISNAGRDFAPRNRFVAVGDLRDTEVVFLDAPDSDFGDPVLGTRFSLNPRPEKWNLVVEAAYKLAWKGDGRLVSTGADDFGVQVSLQRFLRRNAFYVSLAGVVLGTSDQLPRDDHFLPTVVAGWETKLTKHTNLIFQTYWSQSVIQRTTLDELSADKFQATLGVQWLYRGNVLRFGVTENLQNYNNTPDVGVTLSIARVVFGR